MARHTGPNNKRLDDAYPIRVKVQIPVGGLGNMLSEIHVWINKHLPNGRCKNMPVRALYVQATAFHFRTMVDAQSFLDAFPSLELADGLDAP